MKLNQKLEKFVSKMSGPMSKVEAYSCRAIWYIYPQTWLTLKIVKKHNTCNVMFITILSTQYSFVKLPLEMSTCLKG